MVREKFEKLARTCLKVAAAAVLALTGTAAFAQSDADQTTPTGWWWLYNVDAATVTDRIDAGYRLVDLDIADNSPLRFNAAFVRNTGDYAKTFWWYYGLTEAQVTSFVNTNNARIIDIEPYDNGAGATRFAVIMIRNAGEDASGWWWYYNSTTAGALGELAGDNNARFIDFDTYIINGTRYYSCVMVPNTGGNARAWWYYFNVSPAFISTALADNQARLIDLEPHNGDSTFTCIMERSNVSGWWWYYGMNSAQLSDIVDQTGSRIQDIERYVDTDGTTKFAAVLLNNSNALTSRVGEILRDGTNGSVGCYLKQVDGPVLASLRSDYVYEPASCIKVLHHVHAMRQVQLGNIGLNTLVNVFSGYSGSCPQDTGGFTEPLQNALRLMMENSDNARTQAMRVRFGEANINATAAALGMASSGIHHRIGCAGGADGAIADPNELTLADAGRLYEAVADGYINAALRPTFYDLMGNTLPSGLSTIITNESTAAGLTAAQRTAFRNQIEFAAKGGNYGLCSPACIYHQTRFGRIVLPFRNGCDQVPREYVYGTFVNGATNDNNAGNAATTAWNELMREQIRAAANTWRNACLVDWNQDGIVNSADVGAYLTTYFRDLTTGGNDADYDGNGVTTSADVGAFLTDYFRNI